MLLNEANFDFLQKMGLKKAENQVKLLLQDTIIALCRNTLNYCAEVTVEGLLGITLDSDEIFLVSLNETFNNPNVAKKEKANLKRSKDTADGTESESHSDHSDDESGPSKRKKKRHRKKKKRDDSGESGDESASSDNQGNNTAKAHDTTHDESHDNEDESSNRPTPADTRQHGNGDKHRDPDRNDRHSQQDDDEEDLQKIKIKEEADDDDDEDLVFVKEEIGDTSLPHNQYSNYSSEQLYMPHPGMQSGLAMPGQPGTSTGQYSQQDYMGDMSNMSNVSQGSDSQQMMGFSPGQQNIVSISCNFNSSVFYNKLNLLWSSLWC